MCLEPVIKKSDALHTVYYSGLGPPLQMQSTLDFSRDNVCAGACGKPSNASFAHYAATKIPVTIDDGLNVQFIVITNYQMCPDCDTKLRHMLLCYHESQSVQNQTHEWAENIRSAFCANRTGRVHYLCDEVDEVE